MKILFFASLAEFTGTDNITFGHVRNTDELRDMLHQKYPGLSNYNYAIAVNHTIAPGNIRLADDDEVALLPPFSGG